jgi:hypothetical protein
MYKNVDLLVAIAFLFKAEDAQGVEKNVGTICLRNIISGEIVRKTQQSAIPSQFNPKGGCRKNDWQEIPTRSSPSFMLHVRRQIFFLSKQTESEGGKSASVSSHHWNRSRFSSKKVMTYVRVQRSRILPPRRKRERTYLWSIAKFKPPLLRAKFWVCRAAAATR